MKKIILVLVVVSILQGCNTEEQNLPEQGHTGPAIDVAHDLKTSPQEDIKNSSKE